MIEIYEIEENTYQVHSTNPSIRAIEGSLLAISVYLTHSLGIKVEELEAALLDMLDQDRDAANFSDRGMFVYSFNKNQKYGKTA
jgi:hypothetical protein